MNSYKYFIDYGSANKNNFIITNNTKVIYNVVPISNEIYKIGCIYIM